MRAAVARQCVCAMDGGPPGLLYLYVCFDARTARLTLWNRPNFYTRPTRLPGLLCSFAHGREELRREAAVQCGYLHSRYKTLLCDAMMATGM